MGLLKSVFNPVKNLVLTIGSFFVWLWNSKPHWPSGLKAAEDAELARIAKLDQAAEEGKRLGEALGTKVVGVPRQIVTLSSSPNKKVKAEVEKAGKEFVDGEEITVLSVKVPAKKTRSSQGTNNWPNAKAKAKKAPTKAKATKKSAPKKATKKTRK
jgi:hypothetical protein